MSRGGYEASVGSFAMLSSETNESTLGMFIADAELLPRIRAVGPAIWIEASANVSRDSAAVGLFAYRNVASNAPSF